MILGNQKVVYNKVGLGIDLCKKKSNLCFRRNTISRTRITKVWIPKSFVVDTLTQDLGTKILNFLRLYRQA